MGAATDTQLIDTDGASQQRRSFRFSIRILLMAILVIGLGFALWQQQQRLQRAQSLLEAHGLLRELEPVPDDMFRVWVKEVVSKNNLVVHEVTLEANDVPELELLSGNKSNGSIPHKSRTQQQRGGPWRTTFTIAAYIAPLGVSDGRDYAVIDVDVSIENGGYGERHSIQAKPKHSTDIDQYLNIQIDSGDYPRGKPLELFTLKTPDSEPGKVQLLVKLPKSGNATGMTGPP